MKLKLFMATLLGLALILAGLLTNDSSEQESKLAEVADSDTTSNSGSVTAPAPDNSNDTSGETANANASVNVQAAASASLVGLEGADSALGKRFFLQCQACHTVEEGAGNRIGPNLWGFMNRAAGKQDSFQYSAAFADADFSWDLDTLDRFLAKPNNVAPGTTMVFAGISDVKMRRDVIAYLIEATSNP